MAAIIDKTRATRYAANGGKWESDETKRKIAVTVRAKLDEDLDWYAKRTAKCEATKVRNGYDPKWNNREKMRKTLYYSDIKPILDYVETTYGKKYIKQFKTK